MKAVESAIRNVSTFLAELSQLDLCTNLMTKMAEHLRIGVFTSI